MGTLISLDIEVGAIRSFLKAVTVAADAEYSNIKAMSEAGEGKRRRGRWFKCNLIPPHPILESSPK
jgi:hypothetical protein